MIWNIPRKPVGRKWGRTATTGLHAERSHCPRPRLYWDNANLLHLRARTHAPAAGWRCALHGVPYNSRRDRIGRRFQTGIVNRMKAFVCFFICASVCASCISCTVPHRMHLSNCTARLCKTHGFRAVPVRSHLTENDTLCIYQINAWRFGRLLDIVFLLNSC